MVGMINFCIYTTNALTKDLNQKQKEHFLQQQLRAIQDELRPNVSENSDVDELS